MKKMINLLEKFNQQTYSIFQRILTIPVPIMSGCPVSPFFMFLGKYYFIHDNHLSQQNGSLFWVNN